MKKIVYGICGIGNGHLNRQLPIIQYLLNNNNKIIIFTYGDAFEFIISKFNNYLQNQLKVVKVSVPYLIGDTEGINFIKSASINDQIDIKQNLTAFAIAQEFIGAPDLVITDYEPTSAQYGYAYNCPVITFDQQSKYLLNSLPDSLNGFNYRDEVMRLKMFFPIAEKRLACSFFKMRESESNLVEILPPTIRPSIACIKNEPNPNTGIVVYLSAQKGLRQTLSEIALVLKNRLELFTIYIDRSSYKENYEKIRSFHESSNIVVREHGHSSFDLNLKSCQGIICTAGHSLISEAMFLNIPVYAMPLNLYEQQISAQIVGINKFGLNANVLTDYLLDLFIRNINNYRKNILEDTEILYKKDGLSDVLKSISKYID